MAVLDFPACLNTPGGIAAAVAAAFVVGSMVGSFLNVVAHRVPRGETVVHGRSHCPACGATIRARDNVPVFGWLALRGRCRDCGTAISARYPLVEGACGTLAATLALVEIMAAPGGDPGVVMVGWCGRTALALTLVAWALLAEGGHVVAGTTVGTAAVAAAAAAVVLPPLSPLPLGCAHEAWGSAAAWPQRLVASVAGLGAGWMAARAAGCPPAQATCAVIGAALGWQAAMLAAVAAAAGRTIGRLPCASTLAPVVAVLGWHPLAAAWGALCQRWCGG